MPAASVSSQVEAAGKLAVGNMFDMKAKFGKGMGGMMKRMSSYQQGAAKPPPQGYVGLQGGGFSNFGGCSAGDLKVPKTKTKKPSGGGGKMGAMGVKMLNNTINSSLDMVGAG